MNVFNDKHSQLITAANLSSLEANNIAKQVLDYMATFPTRPLIIPCPVFTPIGLVQDCFMWTVEELTAIADNTLKAMDMRTETVQVTRAKIDVHEDKNVDLSNSKWVPLATLLSTQSN